jgi:hypothetical protein
LRYQIKSNGCGGWNVRDARTKADVGGTCSHRRNAQIKADRLNGGDPQWLRFYGAQA